MKLSNYNTNERNAQIVLALLKKRGIKKIVASPGSTNISFVGSVQNDPFFQVYSCVDERSAAYMAVGMAEETGETIVLTCTGATASRNYLSGLTEAYYRKLPIIAITSGHEQCDTHHLIGQVIDRSRVPNDVCVISVLVQCVKDKKDDWDCQIKVNKALNLLSRDGGGPIHLNLETYNTRQEFSIKEISDVRNIQRYTIYDELPILPVGRIGIFVGAHKVWSKELISVVDEFCMSNNAVVFCDNTSGYGGKFKIMAPLMGCQDDYVPEIVDMDLLIHIGEISGSYEGIFAMLKAKEVWRVSDDGEIRDLFKKVKNVFDMPEISFFKAYVNPNSNNKQVSFYEECLNEYEKLLYAIPELPFSNLWIAQHLYNDIPQDSSVHFGILNSLRSWNFFSLPNNVLGFCNVGGFGIDGCMSSLIGASLMNNEKLYFGIFGDLAFMYDMNVLCNRHLSNNVRILLINNGKGQEFRNYYHQGALWGERADEYIAAGGHFGNKSSNLVKHYAEDLGFEYFTASTKNEFLSLKERFVSPIVGTKPILFEVFTNTEEETEALYKIRNMVKSNKILIKKSIRDCVNAIGGEKAIDTVKKIINWN